MPRDGGRGKDESLGPVPAMLEACGRSSSRPCISWIQFSRGADISPMLGAESSHGAWN